MSNRIITLTVAGEHIKKSSSLLGAAGAYNAVTLELSFDGAWGGTTKTLYFFDAYGENPVARLLTLDLLKEGETDIYLVPVPAEPLASTGEATLTIRGIQVNEEDETAADRIMVAASTRFTVMEASFPSEDTAPEQPNATLAEQLQAQMDTIKIDVTTANQAVIDAEAYAESAAESASAAESSAGAATSSASGAAESASTATTKAGEATASSEDAADSAEIATTAAATATTKAEEAVISAADASESRAAAETAATTATTKAAEASASASSSVSSAATSALKASEASESAEEATTAASTATSAVATATTKATLSQSYAVGGTGTRAGEDTDNAKYYKEQAAAIVGADLLTNTGDGSGVTVTFTEASALGNVTSTESLATLFGKLRKWFSSFGSAAWEAASAFAVAVHTHVKADITDFPATMPPSAHTHEKEDITDFPTSLTPTAHKGTHATGGSDALTPADIGAMSEDDVWPRAEVYSETTAALYPGAETPDEALAKLAVSALPWQLIQTYDEAGTYTWTVPDIYGDGLPYEIGVYEVGGGGSGAAVKRMTNEASVNGYACGGASGHARAFLITVTPGDTVSVVVGPGGESAINTGNGVSVSGNSGGSTSFAGVTVNGGEGGTGTAPSGSTYPDGASGGQGSDAVNSSISATAPAMGQSTIGTTAPDFGGQSVFSEAINPFNLKRFLGAGGGAYGRTASSPSGAAQSAQTLDDGTSAGSGAYLSGATPGNAVAPDATGHGNGGGAAVLALYYSYYAAYFAQSGAGSDGAVLIYARGVSA